jgi:hypothetical protein
MIKGRIGESISGRGDHGSRISKAKAPARHDAARPERKAMFDRHDWPNHEGAKSSRRLNQGITSRSAKV